MTLSNDVTIKTRGGLKANLPASAPERELLVTLDTAELFVGTGTGVKQIGSNAVSEMVLFQDTTLGGATIYADAVRPISDPSSRDGWYFKNDHTTGTEHIDSYPNLTATQKEVAKKKINWWFFSGSLTPTKMSELKTAYAIFTADTTQKPFMVLYTTTGKAHIYQAPTNLVAGKSYVYWFGTEAPPTTLYPGLERVQLAKTNTAVPIVATEDIYIIGYQTDSGAVQNTVKLQTYMLGYKTVATSANFTLKTSTSTGSSGATTEFKFNTPTTTWNVEHNLGKRPSVTAVNNNGTEILGEIQYVSDNQLQIKFTTALTGAVYLN